MDKSSESLSTLKDGFYDGLWISWEIVEGKFCLRKISENNSEANEDSETEQEKTAASTTFEWLEGTKENSLVIPLADGETFSDEIEDSEVESHSEEEYVVLLDNSVTDGSSDDDSNEDIDKGKVVPLFISLILSSKEHGDCLNLGTLYFKKVEIFGAVVAKLTTNKRNSLLVDDSTGEINCYMEDSLNADVDYEDEYKIDTNSPYIEMFHIFDEHLKEYEYILPTFEQINVGDKVYVYGKASFYRGNHYVFIEDLVRAKSVDSEISFIEDVLRLVEDPYYDLGDLNTD